LHHPQRNALRQLAGKIFERRSLHPVGDNPRKGSPNRRPRPALHHREPRTKRHRLPKQHIDELGHRANQGRRIDVVEEIVVELLEEILDRSFVKLAVLVDKLKRSLIDQLHQEHLVHAPHLVQGFVPRRAGDYGLKLKRVM
jgi:hypothetical protein